MRIADPFFTIAHVIGSLPAVDDSVRWDRSDRPSSGLLLRQPVRVAEAARAAVIAAPAADAACTFRLKKTSSRSSRMTVRSRRNVIAGDLMVRTQLRVDRWSCAERRRFFGARYRAPIRLSKDASDGCWKSR
jgi:hypothetical protein